MTLVLLLLQTAGLLGPSFFGWIAPGLYARLFPLASLPVLNELSQIGLVLFMFMVGLHLDLTEVYALRRLAGLASLLSSAVPFALGLALARPLFIFREVIGSQMLDRSGFPVDARGGGAARLGAPSGFRGTLGVG